MLNWFNDILLSHTVLTFLGTFLVLMFFQLKGIKLFFFLKNKDSKKDKQNKKQTYKEMKG